MENRIISLNRLCNTCYSGIMNKEITFKKNHQIIKEKKKPRIGRMYKKEM